MASQILTAPPNSGTKVLGKTLTGILDEACRQYSNERALNHPRGSGWQTWSLNRFSEEADEIASGLLCSGLEQGDHVAMFMESDVYFCLVDMGCLKARLVTVPIYLTHKEEQIRYIIEHSESKILVVSNYDRLREVLPQVKGIETLDFIAVAEASGKPPEGKIDLPIRTLSELKSAGRKRIAEEPEELHGIGASITPDDVATIIYTSGTTGAPKGVLLTHENISFNALTSFSGLSDYQSGSSGEVAVSFLPLTHIFVRTLHYGYIATATTVYFTTPDDLSRDLKRVRPTVFASVPRVIEKVYGRILETATQLTGPRKRLLNWALDLASEYEIGTEPSRLWKFRHAVADRLVYQKWRDALGGRVKFIIAGGAALNAGLANLFAAAGVTVLQGYGLTETSPVITYNRPELNRAGTVGVPIPGVEVKLGEGNEILTRGPHVMKGYFKDDKRNAEAIDDDGWFHTGDVGEITPDGFLRITDRMKDLFKLSTGKYVTPQPLESELGAHPLIEQAVVVGAGQKYCTALIFPDQDRVRILARSRGLDADRSIEELIADPVIRERYQELVDHANEKVDHWSEIKRFALLPDHVTIENGLLTPTMKIRRSEIRKAFEQEIRALYEDVEASHSDQEGTAVMDR